MWSSELDWKLLLEYFKVAASWPPLAVIVLVCFMRKFQTEVGVFLTNVRPKGLGFDTLPLPLQSLDTPKPPAIDEGTADSAEGSEGGAIRPDEPSQPQSDAKVPPALSRETVSRVAEVLLASDRQRDDFRYLNSLLVITTQLTLDMVMEAGSLSVADFSASWPQMTAKNRSNMLTVLYQHGIVDVVDGVIIPTEKGRTYSAAPERRAWVMALLSVWSPSPTSSRPAGRGQLSSYGDPATLAENVFRTPSAGTPSSVSGGNPRAKNFFASPPDK